MDGLYERIALFYAGYWYGVITGGTGMDASFLHLDWRSKIMPKPKMIVIWGREDILSTSIELFLAAKADWKVVSITNKDDLDALILAAESTQPDIVIIHRGYPDDKVNLPMQFLQDHPAIQVITISLENNLMDVYSKQKIMVKEVSDLIDVIENEPSPFRRPASLDK